MTHVLRLQASVPLFVVFLLISNSGCNSNGNVAVYPVKGVVMFDGEPMLGGGSIAFIPQGDQQGKGAGGIIDGDGSYLLSTYKEGDGSMTGNFRVLITQTVFDEPDLSGDTDGKGGVIEPIEVVPENYRIPGLYADAMQSPLTANVEATASNEINFKLERQAQ